MRNNANNLEAIEVKEKLEAIQKYVKAQFHPAEVAFVLPQTSVPAALASKAFWGALNSWFGSQVDVSNTTHMFCGIIAGLLFGGNSLYGAYVGTKKVLEEININVTNILSAINSDSLSRDVILRLKQQMENIPTKPSQPLSWNQIVNVAFAWFTATITSFVYSGVVHDVKNSETCVSDKPCSGANVALPIAAAVAALSTLWGICALLWAREGQREQAFLNRVNNRLKDVIEDNSELNKEIKKHTYSVDIFNRGEHIPLVGSNTRENIEGNTSSSSLQNLNREPTPSYMSLPSSPKK